MSSWENLLVAREIDVRLRQHRLDQIRLGVEADPIADAREVVVADEAVRRARADLSFFSCREVVGAPMLHCDAGGRQPGGAVLCERGFPAVVPAKPLQQRFRNGKCQPKLLCVSSVGRHDPPGPRQETRRRAVAQLVRD